MTKPFFYSERLKPYERVVVGIYSAFTIVFFIIYTVGSSQSKQATLIAYTGLPQVFLYLFLYVSLRNFTVYLIFIGFSILHIVMYFFLKNNPELEMARGNPSSTLLNTFALLLLFQLLRYISLKMQKREFVAPSRGKKDLMDNKIISATDYLIFVVYMASWFALTVIPLSN